MRAWRVMVAALVLLGGISAVAAYEMIVPRSRGWQEIAWPFPRDGWPAGRAFRCGAADCGDDVEVYVRAKLGFCNCTTGVADDDEVDRVADVDLISPRFVPVRAGDVVRVAEMTGRIRAYDVEMPGGNRTAIGIAVSRRCDLLVASAQARGDVTRVRHAALTFLGSQEAKRFIRSALDAQ
ncbi:hypothetical protein [Bradyrhizobium lablabi]|uniref:hypothetical protein n=1 Tax=Bradyrhizobium lablabi TaxID=722472 RepID=UPI001BA85250|nr:hypothetical protein [Bradyrhizobium lablabi]MBR0693744.1 hypothetical protein [Bradyrhizobium lablabi]